MRLVVAHSELRERIEDETFPLWNDGLSRAAYGRWNDAQMRTRWGRERLHRLALLDDAGRWLASAKRYRFAARLDGESVEMVGVGAVFTPPAQRGRGYGRQIVEATLDEQAAGGAALAMLFSEIGTDYYRAIGFVPVPLEEVTLRVAARPGSPAMLVRSGTDADLPHLATMHQARTQHTRFALDRHPDLIQFSIAKRRLLAGLGSPGRRQTEFFVAEEGVMAVAYVVITSDESGWFIEEAGDRDPAAARLGALLQVLLAREPARDPPTIRAWWPRMFPLPPQLSIVARTAPADVFMVRPLRVGIRVPAPEDVFYWRSDYF